MLLTGSETVTILVGKQDTQSNAASAIDVNLGFIVEIVFAISSGEDFMSLQVSGALFKRFKPYFLP